MYYVITMKNHKLPFCSNGNGSHFFYHYKCRSFQLNSGGNIDCLVCLCDVVVSGKTSMTVFVQSPEVQISDASGTMLAQHVSAQHDRGA